uniref:Pheromone binding protein 2 n=1 Tax=Maruca vitrata TaxID=497515 RepID=A0A5C1D6R6_MARVT|nr:pheromone binding protein 2 [Maruca vitrata]QEL50345.1 pheromone binding protein 2 [Maruca vitrata]
MWVKMIVAAAVMVMMTVTVESSQVLLKDMTKNFLKAYEQCQQELKLPDSTAKELMYFWKEGYEVKSREAGCTILCLSKKLEILDPEGKLHKGKTADFIKQHGSDDETANKVIDILHTCEANVTPNEDHCLLALDVALCFKNEIHKLNWAPDPEVIFEELMAELE